MPSLVDLPWLVLDLSHSEEDAPWIGQALVERGLEGWEVHQELPSVKWRLYFPLEGEHEARLAELKSTLTELGSKVEESGHIRDEDWAENWKEFYHPFPIGDKLIISPSWEEPDPDMAAGRSVIRLDPGSAFGTGYHESTRLCLQLMEELTKHPKWGSSPLLDYGTGSGILAIGALHLGCPAVVAADRDPVAVAVAKVNLKENKFDEERYQVFRHDIPQKDPLAEGGRYQFVVANLTADILTQLSTPMTDIVEGHLVLGGIVEKRSQKVLDAYTRAGGTLLNTLQENDWVAYHFSFSRD